MSIDEILRAKKVIFVTGKGGVGKTTVALALAQFAAHLGKRVCLIESTFTGQLAPAFGLPAINHQLQELAPQIFAINLNAMDNFRDFVVKHLGFEKLFNKVFNNAIVTSLLKLLPALAEITLLGRVFYTSELSPPPKNFDLVIVDSFASGHFYDLMTTPMAVMKSGIVGPVLNETERIHRFFSDADKCASVLVATPQPLVISECLEFIPKLNSTGLAPIQLIALNRGNLKDLVQGEPAYDFLKNQQDEYLESKKFLTTGLVNKKFVEFNDLGFIDEPITPDFYKQLFSEDIRHV